MIQHNFKKVFLAFILSGSMVIPTQANAIELSIYSSATPGSTGWSDTLPGYAYVIDQRELELKAGQNNIRLTQIPAYLDPTTVQFRSLTDPTGTKILEQEYRFDLVNNQTFLNCYLGKEIIVEQLHGSDIGSITGKLLSTVNGITLQDKNNQIITINNFSAIRFPTMPNNSANTPTLIWNIAAKNQGLHKTEIRYQTKEITWWADYNAIFEEATDPNQGSLELSSWISIMNKTGMSFEDASLKLVAGNMNTAQSNRYMARPMMAAKMSDSVAPEGFSEQSLFEYHMYTLNGKLNLANNTAKQIPFLSSTTKIPVEKQYIFDGSSSMQYSGYTNTDKDINTNANTKIDVYLKWTNNEKSGLGIPLPAGRIRISAINKTNKDPEFIGEDIIDHTANNTDIQVKMGSAFDMSATKKQMDFSLDNNRHIIEETFEITLKNHKDKDVKITVKESLYRAANWEILKGSTAFEKVNSGIVKFPVVVKANGETKVNYTVRYTW